MENNQNIIEIEEALLGLILTNNKIDENISNVFVYLDFDYFSNKPNQEMFKMFKYFYENNIKEFDLAIINNYLIKNSLTKIINNQYLNHLLNNAGYLQSVNYYQDVINENATKNRLKNALESSLKVVNNNPSNLMIEKIRNDLFKLEGRNINSDFLLASEVAKKVVDDVLSGEKLIKGLKTRSHTLDGITAGLQKGDLIILAARPSVGKTAFALNIAMNVILQNKSVVFFSLEMPAEQLMQRMIASIASVNNYHFKEPSRLTKDEQSQIIYAYNQLKDKKFFIDDSGSIRLNEIIWKTKRLKEKGELDLVIIDYMQLIPLDAYSSGNRQQEVSKISRSLKQLARELEVPIIALSQLNRRVEERESKRPMMSDLRESGSIEQDADIIAFLYREDYYNKDTKDDDEEANKFKHQHLTELNIAKHRNGSIGTIQFTFDSAIGKFKEFHNE